MSRQRTAELMLFATTFIWGSTFVVIKWGLVDLSPLLLLALRFTLAAGLFLPLCVRSLRTTNRATFLAGSGLGLLLLLGLALQTTGLQYTTASKSAFITGLFVIFTPFVQYVVVRRTPTPANLLGVVIVTLGLWFLTDPQGSGLNRGDGLTFLCALTFAVYIVYVDLASKFHDVLHLTFFQILAGAAISWVGVGLLEAPVFRPTATALWVVVYLALAATILTGYIQTRYQRDTTPIRAAIIFTVEPIWAVIFAGLALDERLGPLGLLGGGLILLGVLVSEISAGRPPWLRPARRPRKRLGPE